MRHRLKKATMGLAAILVPVALHAQATVVGYPANFDAVNDTGQVTHGFEIEADGIQVSDVDRIFGGSQPACFIRYCTGSVVPFAGGVFVLWVSPYNATTHQFTLGTPLSNASFISGESCWTGSLGSGYAAAGREYFSISSVRSPMHVVYRWLVEDPSTPGNLVYYSETPAVPNAPPIPVAIPQPQIIVVPPAQAGGAPIVNFQIQLPAQPQRPRAVPQWGDAKDAKWVKVYQQDLDNKVDLNDLLAGNPAVPDDPAESETP